MIDLSGPFLKDLTVLLSGSWSTLVSILYRGVKRLERRLMPGGLRGCLQKPASPPPTPDPSSPGVSPCQASEQEPPVFSISHRTNLGLTSGLLPLHSAKRGHEKQEKN